MSHRSLKTSLGQRDDRTRHRRLSHAQSHDQAMDAPPAIVLDHPLVSKNAPVMVDRRQDLNRLLEHLAAQKRFAFDSEFIGENSYYPKLCLIQIATDDQLFIIAPPPPLTPDPAAEDSPAATEPSSDEFNAQDLMGFWELIADPSIEKVVHAGAQDLAPTLRHTGHPPAKVFDVQLAAGFTGLNHPMALDKLALALLNADLGPGLKFSQWDQRPLTPAQIAYAANDVRYLLAMRQVLQQRLESNGNLAAAMEECGQFCRESTYRFDAEQARVKARGVQFLTPKEQLILQALLVWRDRTACMEDLPARSILPDGVMTEMARRKPKAIESLRGARGLPGPVVDHHGQAILDTIAAARQQPTPAKPPPCKLQEPELKSMAQAWWEQAAKAAVDRQIEPKLLTSKRELTTALWRIHSGQPVGDLRLSQGWRAGVLPSPPFSPFPPSFPLAPSAAAQEGHPPTSADIPC